MYKAGQVAALVKLGLRKHAMNVPGLAAGGGALLGAVQPNDPTGQEGDPNLDTMGRAVRGGVIGGGMGLGAEQALRALQHYGHMPAKPTMGSAALGVGTGALGALGGGALASQLLPDTGWDGPAPEEEETLEDVPTQPAPKKEDKD